MVTEEPDSLEAVKPAASESDRESYDDYVADPTYLGDEKGSESDDSDSDSDQEKAVGRKRGKASKPAKRGKVKAAKGKKRQKGQQF
jgi:hypothetical protein